MKNKTLDIAKSKVRSFYKRTYCGHLTPSEFLALVKAGIQASPADISDAERYKSKGDSSPSWYYFQLGKVDLIYENIPRHSR